MASGVAGGASSGRRAGTDEPAAGGSRTSAPSRPRASAAAGEPQSVARWEYPPEYREAFRGDALVAAQARGRDFVAGLVREVRRRPAGDVVTVVVEGGGSGRQSRIGRLAEVGEPGRRARESGEMRAGAIAAMLGPLITEGLRAAGLARDRVRVVELGRGSGPSSSPGFAAADSDEVRRRVYAWFVPQSAAHGG